MGKQGPRRHMSIDIGDIEAVLDDREKLEKERDHYRELVHSSRVMSSFTERPWLEPDDSGAKFKVVRSFEYHIDHLGSGNVIRVPAGFITDLASIPRAARSIIPRLGKHLQAAIVHDFLYKTKSVSRKKADDIFLEAMEVLGVPVWKRYSMYYSVRMFGWLAWKHGEP